MPRPDEGLIHSWLDGQLPPDEAARIEALAATDPEWAAAVAEARGLVAASSRILSALDHVPAGVVPKRPAARSAQRLPWWTKIAAAVVVVVGGSVVVLQGVPDVGMSTTATEQGTAQPTRDAPQATAPSPVGTAPVPSASRPTTPAQGPAMAAGAAAGTGAGRPDVRARQGEMPAAPAPSVSAVVAEERKAVQDADRAGAEPTASKTLAAKEAPAVTPPVQQRFTQEFTQAQNAMPAQRVAGGVASGVASGVAAAQRAPSQQASLCYRLVPDSAHAGAAVLMRAVRADGDTLRLVPVEPNASQRAWIAWRDGMKGVMTTSDDLRSAVRVVATPALCPGP